MIINNFTYRPFFVVISCLILNKMCIGQSDTVHFDSLNFKTSCDKVLFLSNSKVYLHNPYFLSRLVNYHRRCVLTVSEYYYHSKDIFDYSIDLKCEFPESVKIW